MAGDSRRVETHEEDRLGPLYCEVAAVTITEQINSQGEEPKDLPHEGIKQLVLAVLRNAIQDLNSLVGCHRASARIWFAELSDCGEGEALPFSFGWCCLVLGVESERLRSTVYSLTEHERRRLILMLGQGRQCGPNAFHND
jgi:hypothetical protein